jgi:ArsR family transcriptional regulator, virulence genes transcriptional regulator
MKSFNFKLFELQAELCQMMANPKRVALIDILGRGECSVGELAKALSSSISATSQHLRTLKDKNVVLNRKDGQTVYYKLKNPKLIEGCHIMREVLLEEMESQGRIARDYDEVTTLSH